MEDTLRNLKFFLFGDYAMCLWTGGTIMFIGWIFIVGFCTLLTR